MKTLIIPCAGGSEIDERPLYIMHHPDGKLFLEKCIEGMHAESFGCIVIVVLANDENKFHVKSIIENKFNRQLSRLKIVILPKRTNGPAETVYEAIKVARIKGQVVVKDVISSIDVPEMDHRNYIAGLNLTTWKQDIHDIRRKSFILLNEQKQVLDIIEKQIRSENISVGLYGFNDADDFLFAYKRLNDKNYPIQCLYISHIISYLIGYKNKVFHYLPVSRFEEWGTEKAWMEIQRRYSNYFLNLDSLFGSELNYQDHKDIFDALKTISDNGATFVGFTSNDESVKKKTKKFFADEGINCIQVVYGCSMSKMKMIISCSEEIKQCLYTL